MNTRAEHAVALLDALNQLKEDESTVGSCDLRLTVGDQHLLVHRLVLVAVSDYFRAMFAHNFVEKHQSEVRLNAMEFEHLKAAVDFIYTGTVEISDDNIEGLLIVATHLQIGLLVSACEKYLLEKLNVMNVREIEIIVDRYSLCHLNDSVQHFIRNNFLSLATKNTEYFWEFSVEQLRSLLDDDMLNVQNDSAVIDVISAWVKAKRTERVHFLVDLLSRLRFINPTEFTPLVAEFEEASQSLKLLESGYVRVHDPDQHQVAACFKPRRSTPSLAVYYDGSNFRQIARQLFRLVRPDVFSACEHVSIRTLGNLPRSITAGDALQSRNCQFLDFGRVNESMLLLVGKQAMLDQQTLSNNSDPHPVEHRPASTLSALEFLVATDNASSAGACALAQYCVSLIVIGGRVGYDDSVASLCASVSRVRCNQKLFDLHAIQAIDAAEMNLDVASCAHLAFDLPVAEHAACTVAKGNCRCVFISGGLSYFDQQRFATDQSFEWRREAVIANSSTCVQPAWNRCAKIEFSADGEHARLGLLPNLNEPRSYHAMLEHRGSLYVFGGVRRGELQSDERYIAAEMLSVQPACSVDDPTWKWTVLQLTCLSSRCALQFAVLNDSIYSISKQIPEAGWNTIYRLHFDERTAQRSWHRCQIEHQRPVPVSGERRSAANHFDNAAFSFAHCFPTHAAEHYAAF